MSEQLPAEERLSTKEPTLSLEFWARGEDSELSKTCRRAIATIDRLTAERDRLREALERLESDSRYVIDFYERNGPQWTSRETGYEYYSADLAVLERHAHEPCADADAWRRKYMDEVETTVKLEEEVRTLRTARPPPDVQRDAERFRALEWADGEFADIAVKAYRAAQAKEGGL